MKKGDPIPERKIVEYKGDTFVLQPGHKVFELNTKSGEVKEHKLVRVFDLLFWRKPRYTVTYKEHLLHTPAFDLHKAKIKFKQMTRKTDIPVK
jgi:hypothetical protein